MVARREVDMVAAWPVVLGIDAIARFQAGACCQHR
jgi:hypothetical protein